MLVLLVSNLFFWSLWHCGWGPKQRPVWDETIPGSSRLPAEVGISLRYLPLLSRVLWATWGSRRGHGTGRFALVGLAGIGWVVWRCFKFVAIFMFNVQFRWYLLPNRSPAFCTQQPGSPIAGRIGYTVPMCYDMLWWYSDVPWSTASYSWHFMTFHDISWHFMTMVMVVVMMMMVMMMMRSSSSLPFSLLFSLSLSLSLSFDLGIYLNIPI